MSEAVTGARADAGPLVTDTDHLKSLLGIPYSDEQLEAITAPLGQAQAIIAGAGSGKTAVMAARVVWLVGHVGVKPEEILGLTFTTKAAAELRGRVRASLARAGISTEEGEPEVQTYHAFASALIREQGLRIGLEPDMQVLTPAKRFQLAANVVHTHEGGMSRVSTHTPTVVNDMLALDGQLSEHLVTSEQLRDEDRALIAEIESLPTTVKRQREAVEASLKRIELSGLVDEYREAKRLANVMDFSDQMAWGAQLAELPEVKADLQSRFSVVLLDEYQDTSIAQRDFLRSLFLGLSISAVGDPAQGIYGWRGAASGNLTGFLDDFTPEGEEPGTAFSLSVTRRCAPEIIDLAGVIAKEFYNLDSVKAVVKELEAAPENAPGEVSVALHESITDEIDALVDAVEAEHARVSEWSKIAVLVRISKENSELVRALRKRGIPVELVGLTGLLSQPEVLDVLSVIEVLDDVTNNPAMLRLLTGPRWRIGDRDLVRLGRRAKQLAREYEEEVPPAQSHEDNLKMLLDEATKDFEPTLVHSLLEAIESPGDEDYSEQARERFADVAAMFGRLRRHAHEPLPDLYRLAVRELDLDVELDVAGIGTDNLALLGDAISDYSADEPYATLSGLLAYLDAERENNNGMEVAAPTEANSVKILTIHKAKGLEFATVFIPFVSKDVFPNKKSRDSWVTVAKALPHSLRGDGDQLPVWDVEGDKHGTDFGAEMKKDSDMEEVRLAYVGFTRAETKLHISGHYWGRTQKNPRGSSRFLETVKEWLAKRGIEPTTWADPPEEDAINPNQVDTARDWPAPVAQLETRREFAELVRAQQAAGESPAEDTDADAEVSADLVRLAREVDALLAEADAAESDVIEVERPASLSVTSLMSAAKDEAAFAAQLARPMPRRPAAAARFGTRFHAWVESRYGQQSLFDPEDLPGRGDDDIDNEPDLEKLQAAFEKSVYANREPAATEESFTLQLGSYTAIGTIDAVFATDDGYEVVDWKTNRAADADPLQLALYRLAWAESHGLDPSKVTASFYYVRLDKTVTYTDLPGRAELETQLGLA